MRIRKTIEGFEAYGWETPSREIAEKVGLKESQIVRLDTNASPFIPSDELKQVAKVAEKTEVNQYPDTSYLGLREGLAAYCNLGIDRFVVTNGADEGLDIASKVLLDNGDEAVVPVPTYSMFRIVTEIMGGRVRFVKRDPTDFALSADKVLEAVTPKTKLVFLCNPNSPTGNPTPISEVEKIAKEAKAAVLVDEAYYEFWGETAAGLTARYDNLIVCRTFSKAFSMAGVRVGYLVAGKATVDKLNIVRPPNSLSVISIMLGEAALQDVAGMRANVKKIVGERKRVYKELKSSAVKPYPGETNFILFRVKGGPPKAEKLRTSLIRKGLVLRSYSKKSGIGDCLRVTIGSRDQNDRFLAALSEA